MSAAAAAPDPVDTGLVCPTCGEPTALGDVFCEACGADLPATVAPAAAATAEEVHDEGLSLPTDSVFAAPCPSCGAAGVEIVEGYCGVCGMKQPAARDHMEATADGVAAVTDKGKRHHRNEDAFAMAVTDDGRVLAVVCDGVSTTVDPDIASQAASDAALAVLAADGDLPAAYAAARAAVLAQTWVPDPRLGAPSCTFLAAVVDGAQVELATLGDCRSMWLPAEGEPETLTEDDSWAAEVIAAGTKTAEEAYADRRAHVITRWLGADADPSWEARLSSFTAPGPGRLLLCSDGLWNYAETAAEVAAAAAPPDGDPAADDLLSTARRLTDFANAAGGSDNITVLLVDLPRSKGPAA
ncbi:MAG TPA: protein phosphatase 2C domain-containing protein [Acidimicrobiales bacterium]